MKRNVPLKSKTSAFGSKLTNKGLKKRKAPTMPSWVKAIPESQAHGSGTLQKRLWRLTSDYVRIRDWYKYGVCVATGKRINHWTEGQAGHFKAYSKCNGIYKFDRRNIHLQAAQSNSWGDYEDWKLFEAEIYRRGVNLDEFITENNLNLGTKLDNLDVIAEMRIILREMDSLPEKPSYYKRVMSLLKW